MRSVPGQPRDAWFTAAEELMLVPTHQGPQLPLPEHFRFVRVEIAGLFSRASFFFALIPGSPGGSDGLAALGVLSS